MINEVNNQVNVDAEESWLGKLIVPALASLATGVGVHVYDKWHEKKAVGDAYKRGMDVASQIYKEKFAELTDAFLSKEKIWREHEAEYLELIDEYEALILELKVQETSIENDTQVYFFEHKLDELKNLQQIC